MSDYIPPEWLARADKDPARRLGALYPIERHDAPADVLDSSLRLRAHAEHIWLGAVPPCELRPPAHPHTMPGTVLRPPHNPAAAPSLPALAAILSSRYLRAWLWPTRPPTQQSLFDDLGQPPLRHAPHSFPDRLRSLPMPPVAPELDAQLRLLWHFRDLRTCRQKRAAILDTFNRIVAEIYTMTLDELMDFDRKER